MPVICLIAYPLVKHYELQCMPVICLIPYPQVKLGEMQLQCM